MSAFTSALGRVDPVGFWTSTPNTVASPCGASAGPQPELFRSRGRGSHWHSAAKRCACSGRGPNLERPIEGSETVGDFGARTEGCGPEPVWRLGSLFPGVVAPRSPNRNANYFELA